MYWKRMHVEEQERKSLPTEDLHQLETKHSKTQGTLIFFICPVCRSSLSASCRADFACLDLPFAMLLCIYYRTKYREKARKGEARHSSQVQKYKGQKSHGYGGEKSGIKTSTVRS